MCQSDSDVLWLIFQQIGILWGNAGSSDMPQAQFDQVVAQQGQLNPAYEGYYTDTIALYQELLQVYGGNQQQALTQLFLQNQLPQPAQPDVANFVLLEFMRWQVAFGGFRAFGYENYNGWMGGGSFLQVPPPYRALP